MADTYNINNFQYPTKRENFQSTRELSKLSCQESIYVRVEIFVTPDWTHEKDRHTPQN